MIHDAPYPWKSPEWACILSLSLGALTLGHLAVAEADFTPNRAQICHGHNKGDEPSFH